MNDKGDNSMGFILEYIKHPRRIGAVAPSGKSLARRMMQPIDFSTANVIVEFGPGTGSFTKELIARRRPETVLLLIEQNAQFCSRLRKKFGDAQNVRIVHGYAQEVNTYLRECGFAHADAIVSGLPFTTLPREVSDRILTAASTAMGAHGQFVTFQYSMVKRRLFARYFRITGTVKVVRNLPPAYVLVMRNPG